MMRPFLCGALLLVVSLGAGCRAAPGPDGGGATDAAIERDAGVPVDLTVFYDLAPVAGPTLLSQTGLYSDFKARALAPGIFAYEPRYPLWSDGDEKARYLLLPTGAKIDTSDMDNWLFPVGTKAWKQFTTAGTVVETRLLEKVLDGPMGWWEVAYRWKDDGSDAVAAPAGEDNVLGTSHKVPSQMDCNACHDGVSDVLIGVSAIQLSARGGAGALSQLAAMGALSDPPPSEFQVPGSGVVQQALGYLHGNCGHCHNPLSLLWRDQTKMPLRLSVLVLTPEESGIYHFIGKPTIHTSPAGSRTAIVAGAPDKSQLYERMGYRDLWAMPPVCTKVIDLAGRTTIRDWIAGLPH